MQQLMPGERLSQAKLRAGDYKLDLPLFDSSTALLSIGLHNIVGPAESDPSL
jgi:hypothetical protein